MTVSILRGGLYAITPGRRDDLLSRVEQALLGGTALLQYRDKSDDVDRRRQEALAIKQLCDAHQVPLIINDDAWLAKAVDAAGVHLGGRDMSVADARAILGPQAIIGVGCYNSIERAQQLAAEGASYLGFGAFYKSPTKPHANQADPAVLRQAASFGLPIVAIGGVTPENGEVLIEAGADYLAAITGVFDAADVRTAAAAYAALPYSHH